MDLGCLDLGCISLLDKQNNNGSSVDLQRRSGDAEESVMGTTKFGKIKVSKDTGQSSLNAVNKSTSQIKKPHRKNSSPLNWFPRKKTDSYLKRKIRLLQEVGGMNATLDETLGDSNPHYSRVLREKMAAKEAARKAMEARKAALVEASWCRILRAARIQSKEAESLLLKAEKNVDEAFEAAAAMGVIMYDKPDCPQKPCEIASSVNIGGSTTHTVMASFETAFDVDKEVAAAVKTAFVRLANCSSSLNKDEFRDLLRTISQNPDTGESKKEVSEFSSECESDTGSELESDSQRDGFVSEDVNHKIPDTGLKQRKCKDRKLAHINSIKLVDMMLERIKCLQEEELASLATIVATCGLNAALLEVENSKLDPLGSTGGSTRTFTSLRKPVVTGLPSLDKVLVKHMSRLEREVQEAKNTRKNEHKEGSERNPKGSEIRVDNSSNTVTSSHVDPDLGSILVKNACKLERDIQAAKESEKAFEKHRQLGNTQGMSEIPSLDKFLVRHVSRLEREVQEAKNKAKHKPTEESEGSKEGLMNMNKKNNATLSEAAPDLGSILIKHSSKLEKEIAETKKKSGKTFGKDSKQLGEKKDVPEVPSLDKFLVKHVSRLEREVQEAKSTRKTATMESTDSAYSDSGLASSMDIPNSNDMTSSSCIDEQVGKENLDMNKQVDGILDGTVKEQLEIKKIENQSTIAVAKQEEPVKIKYMSRIERAKLETQEAFSSQGGNGTYSSLDSVFVKPVHRLEREKMQALALEREYGQKKKEVADTSECESLDKVLVKHVSRLEKEKMGTKEELMKVGRCEPQYKKSVDGLDQVLVKHQSKLGKEKLAAAQQKTGDGQTNKHFETRREAKQRELQEAWGGLSLGNSIRPHVSRLEREKAAWVEAEEEERMQSTAL